MLARPILFALVIAAGCSKPKPAPEEDQPASQAGQAGGAPAAGPVTPDVAKGKELFNQRCVPCHGSTGHGDGPASASLNPKPRKFADGDWQSQVTDDYIEKIIQLGGAAVGKSPAMPSNPDLQSQPQVVAGLRTVVRGFRPN
jgi:mono/diheme cytochrome c family protein